MKPVILSEGTCSFIASAEVEGPRCRPYSHNRSNLSPNQAQARRRSDPILLNPPIQRPSTQPQSICRMAHIALAPRQRLANQHSLHLLQRHLIEPLRSHLDCLQVPGPPSSIRLLRAISTARSIVWSSSRTFPGHP